MTPEQRKAVALVLATAIAIPAEGLRQKAYFDPPGVLSVCYGTTTNVDRNRIYSVPECRALLDKDMLNAVTTVERCAPGLPPQALAAFADSVYNIGPRIACDKTNSTAARYLAAGNYIAACRELPKWDKSRVMGVMVSLPGLTKRRAKEMELCLS